MQHHKQGSRKAPFIPLFVALVSSSLLATQGDYLKSGEREKVKPCNEKFLRFLTHHYLFEKVNFDKTCTCQDVDPLLMQKYSLHIKHHLYYFANLQTHCHENLKPCQNITADPKLADAKSADEYCQAVNKMIDEKFRTPFSSPQLKDALLITDPIYAAPDRKRAELACELLLKKAKLHPGCSGKGGPAFGTEDSRGLMKGSPKEEEKPKDEGLH